MSENGKIEGRDDIDYTKEDAKIVREVTDLGEGYAWEKFGFCIGDRVFMVGVSGYGYDEKMARAGMALCNAIVNRWNAKGEP
jgi:hypothetical protein